MKISTATFNNITKEYSAESFAFGGSDIQRKMLEDEGIVFEADGHIDLEKYLWKQ